jgi:hypothetical protein
VKETGSPNAAAKHLAAALGGDGQVVIWVDLATMPTGYLPAGLNGGYTHVVRIVEHDPVSGTFGIDDRATTPWVLQNEELAQARKKYPALKHRLLTIEQPQTGFDLEQAICDGIRAGYAGLTGPAPFKGFAANFGLAAFAKWADLVANERDKKGWPRVFKPGQHLHRALVNLYYLIEIAGTGGAFRTLYADFLDEASGVLSRLDLATLGRDYQELGRRWTTLAHTALPDGVPSLAETRTLLDRQHHLLYMQGQRAVDELRRASERLLAIEAEVSESFPLSASDVQTLFREMQGQLRRIYTAEVDAGEQLGRI